MYYIVPTDTSLYHHGILGMKWGVRRSEEELRSLRADNKTRRTLKRHVSADVQNLKLKGRLAVEKQKAYNEASDEYKKASSKIFIRKKNKDALVKEAGEKLSKAGKDLESDKANYDRANRIYDADAKKYMKHVDDMIKKYGEESVSSLKSKTINIGEVYTKDIIKTGVTVANFPLVGRYYSGRYTSKRELEDRQQALDEEAKKRY